MFLLIDANESGRKEKKCCTRPELDREKTTRLSKDVCGLIMKIPNGKTYAKFLGEKI
jgi:hypothetical protein